MAVLRVGSRSPKRPAPHQLHPQILRFLSERHYLVPLPRPPCVETSSAQCRNAYTQRAFLLGPLTAAWGRRREAP